MKLYYVNFGEIKNFFRKFAGMLRVEKMFIKPQNVLEYICENFKEISLPHNSKDS